MPEFFTYVNRFQSMRGQLGALPTWARAVVTVFALPGILLALLSLALFLVSILALLLLALPVYRLLQGMSMPSSRPGPGGDPLVNAVLDAEPSPGRKAVEVRVVQSSVQ